MEDVLAKVVAGLFITIVLVIYTLFSPKKRQFIKHAVIWLFLGWIGGLIVMGILFEYCKGDSWACVLLGS